MDQPGKSELLAAARTARAAGNWMRAAECWGQCIGAFPGHPHLGNWRAERASALTKAGRVDEAAAEFELLAQAGSADAFANLARLAAARGDKNEAVERWDACVSLGVGSPLANRWRAQRALALIEVDRAKEAEAELTAVIDLLPPEPWALVGFARVAAKSGDWGAAADRWARCLQAFPDASAVNNWRRAEARALQQAKRWREAAAAWDGLCSDAAKDEAPLQRARCRFEAEGSSEAAYAEALRLSKLSPDDGRALDLLKRHAMTRGERARALTLLMRIVELDPTRIAPYVEAARLSLDLNDRESAERLFALAPPELRDDPGFKARAMLFKFRIDRDIGGGLAFARAIGEQGLDRQAAVAVGEFMWLCRVFDELEAFTARMLQRFPAAPEFIALRLRALYCFRGVEAFRAEKASLLSPLAATDKLAVFGKLPGAWLTADEARLMLAALGESVADGSFERRMPIALYLRGETEILDQLAAAAASSGSPIGRWLSRLAVATLEDRARIARSCLGGVSWRDFADAHQRLRAEDEAALAEPLGDDLAAIVTTASRFGASYLYSRESFHAAASFAYWLAERVRRREPTSVIRLGEGEGVFLPYEPDDLRHRAQDRYVMQRVWWGQARFSDEDEQSLSARFQQAILNADAVGAPAPRRLLAVPPRPPETHLHRGLGNNVRFLQRAGDDWLENKVLTSSHIHDDLGQWDLYRQIFAATSTASVVSCHDLRPILARKFGLEVREQLTIPPEFEYAYIMGESGRADTAPFYPDVFERIMATIAPEPGELWLVAAGFLGKLICDRIRSRGGIGLDVGSMADQWVGHVTRSITEGDLVFDVASSLIEGQPFGDGFLVPMASGPCFSDDSGRRDLLAAPALLRERPSAAPRHKLRAIGHPACGSSFTAAALSRLGLRVGHERLHEDGICAWMSAVDDLNPPYKAPITLSAHFDVTLAYVRDPQNAVPSIITENNGNRSFSFRRFHIQRSLGVDIARRRDPVEHAVESYLCWMEIVDRQNPLATLRVESLVEDLEAVYERILERGIVVDWTLREAARSTPKAVNSSASKPLPAKPVLAEGWIGRLPADLRDMLGAFCERHGYG